MQEARDRGLELVAPSEAGEVTFGVIGAGLAVGSSDRALDVSERGIDPLEGRHAGCLAPGAGAGFSVIITGMAKRGPAGEAIGDDLGVGGQPALYAACDLALAAEPAWPCAGDLGGWSRP